MTASATASEWVGVETPVEVAGAALEGAYVGGATTPETVDPDLPVDLSAPDWPAASVARPPHYGELTPAARAAFLIWHRTGRRAPQAPATWALLHLYGLERRMLVDGDDDPQLRREAAELGGVYGADLEVARVAEMLGGHPRPTRSPALDDQPVPDELQVELGRRALGSEPIDAEWALAWAWYHPDLPRRDAARRFPDEFARLWRHRFSERFSDGFLAKPRRRRLALEYRPANPSLPTPLELTVDDASDVFLTPAPARLFTDINDQVESELASYVRWATSHPEEIGTVHAAAVLPAPLLAGSPAEAAAQPLVDYAETVLGEDHTAIADCVPLLNLWLEAARQDDVERRDSVALAQVLDRYGFGIEPDVRFGGRPISRRSPAVLFRQAGVPVTSPSEAYAAALVTLELCAAVASADGVVDEDEQALLVEQVHRVEGLTDAERVRLDAHRLLLTTSNVDLDDVAARVVVLAEQQRRGIGSYLLDVAQVDGVVTDDERRTVRAVYELLALDPGEVDDRLGALVPPAPPPPDLLPADTTPTSARPVELFALEPVAAEEDSGGDSLFVLAPTSLDEGDESAPPNAPVEAASAAVSTELALEDADDAPDRLVALDESRLRATQRSNSAVQDLLGAIFAADEHDAVDAEPEAEAAGPTPLAALDTAHSALLRDLASRERTTRPDLERAAARFGVLPDGALDVINEAALDLTDELVIEVLDDESVMVDSAIYEEMCA